MGLVLSVFFVNFWVPQIATSMFIPFAHVEGSLLIAALSVPEAIFSSKSRNPQRSQCFTVRFLTYTHLTINSVVLIKVHEFQVNIKIR